ncbi:MAG: DUF3592 domain-containing protein [Gammaproteobacteria bacterium]|nr:MAG: DUF3592 domain-containing protein [Gammaproteobacteria bacterium]
MPLQLAHLNPNQVILSVAAAGGLGVAFWGWRVLQRSRRTARWPAVEGEIVESRPRRPGEGDPLVPHIVFRYSVDGREHRCAYRLPEGAHPFSDYSEALLRRYPVGQRVRVHYDPEDPDRATLEPQARDDWVLLALGLATAAVALALLLLA